MKRIFHICFFVIALTTSWIVVAQTLVTNPANGHFCQGSTAIQISIDHSENGGTYNLRKQRQVANQATVTGNGNTISFPGLFQAGTYGTIPATSAATVVMDPLPDLFVLSASNNGAYCNYEGSIVVFLFIQPTQVRIDYELFIGTTS